MTDNFDRMDKRDVIRHARAYAAQLHKLAKECSAWRNRFGRLEDHREAIGMITQMVKIGGTK